MSWGFDLARIAAMRETEYSQRLSGQRRTGNVGRIIDMGVDAMESTLKCLLAGLRGLLLVFRADSAPDAFSRMLQQRPGSHGASAAARIADVLSMAQAAVRKERQRAAATPAPILVRAGGARGAVRGRCASAASGRMRSVNVVSSRRAKSAGASQQQGIATSPFVTAGVVTGGHGPQDTSLKGVVYG